MLKAIAASLLGKKPADHIEVPKRGLARREIESLFRDELAAHADLGKTRRKADPAHV